MQPYVTVVIPIYNVEKYLEKCINSVQNQTLKNIEIILIDDESPDNCPDICDQMAMVDSRIRVIHKKNAGLGFARNSGIEVAQGKYIAFIDADDYIETNMMEELYKLASSINADAVISGGFIYEYPNGKSLIKQDVKEDVLFEGDITELPLFMMGADPSLPVDYIYEMSACRGIYNLELLKQHNIYFLSEREFISEDLLFHFDFSQKAQKIYLTSKCYYHYRKNVNSLTKSFDVERFSRNVDLYNYVLNYLNNSNYQKEEEKFILYADRMLLARARVAVGQTEEYYGCYGKEFKRVFNYISKEDTLKQLLKRYPILQLPLKHRLFVLCLKYNTSFLGFVLVWINNKRHSIYEMK